MPKHKGTQKKGNKWYWYIDYRGDRHWSRGFSSAEEAAMDRTRQKNKFHDGTHINANTITFQEFAIEYLKRHVSQFRRGTFEIREICLRKHILPILGNLRLQDIRPYHVEELQNTLLKSNTVNNTRKIMSTLRNALKRAEIWELIVSNPALKVEMPKPQRHEKKILDPEQFIKLLDHCELLRDRFILSLASYAGLRKGEIFGLQWKDFDFKKNTLTLQRQWSRRKISPLKTEKSRATIPLMSELVQLAKEWKLECKSFTWVFPARHGKNPMDAETWNLHTFKRLLKQNNLPDVTLHSLRHSFASTAIASGVSVADLQELMRHSTYHVTMNVYRHTLPGQLEEALNKYRNYICSIRRKKRRKNDFSGS